MKLKDYISNICKDVGDKLIATLELDIELDDKLNVVEGGGQRMSIRVHNIK